jgi:hypothetical protein
MHQISGCGIGCATNEGGNKGEDQLNLRQLHFLLRYCAGHVE